MTNERLISFEFTRDEALLILAEIADWIEANL